MVNKEGNSDVNSTALLDIQGYCSDNETITLDGEIEEVVIDDQNTVRIKLN